MTLYRQDGAIICALLVLTKDIQGRSPTHGPEPDSQRIEDGGGAARSAQREDTAPSETTRKARRLSFDFPGQGCWADITKRMMSG